MIIKPYIPWPKFSKLKKGDRIRLRENVFITFSDFNHKWVIIKQISHSSQVGISITCEFIYKEKLHTYSYPVETYEVEL